MIKTGYKLKASKILQNINLNLPITTASAGIDQSLSSAAQLPEPAAVTIGSFQQSLSFDSARSASFRRTPTKPGSKSKSKSKSSKKDSFLQEFSPFQNSFDGVADDAFTALTLGEEVTEDKSSLLSDRNDDFQAAVKRAVEIPAAEIPFTAGPASAISAEEQATINLIDKAIESQDLEQIYSLLELPFAEKYLFLSSYIVPGIFWLAAKSNPENAIAIFKVGPARGLHDLTLLKFSQLLGMENFFPKSLIKAISVGKFFEVKPLPEEFADRPIAEDTDLANIRCLALDKHHEYHVEQKTAIDKKSLLVGSFQEFVKKSFLPIKPIDAARMVIFGYLLFVKDFKIDDGGVINSVDGFPKMVDLAENGLAYSSVLLPENAEKGILSIHLPLIDQFKNHPISLLEIDILHKQFKSDRRVFVDGLYKILHEEQIYAEHLQKVLAERKVEPTTFHEGHTFVADSKKLAEAIYARLLLVSKALEKIQSEGQAVTILQLLDVLDPQYVHSYKLAQKAKAGDDLDGRISRQAMDMLRGSSSTPGTVVGSHSSPYTFNPTDSYKLAWYADKLFVNIDQLLESVNKDVTGKDPSAHQKKILKKLEITNKLFDDVKHNFPYHPSIGFPQEGLQLYRAKKALIDLDGVMLKVAPILQANPQASSVEELALNFIYLESQIAIRESQPEHRPYSRSTSLKSFPFTPTAEGTSFTPLLQLDKGSPEIGAILDLNQADQPCSNPISDSGSIRLVEALGFPLGMHSSLASKLLTGSSKVGFIPKCGAFKAISTLPESTAADKVLGRVEHLDTAKPDDKNPPAKHFPRT